MNEIVKIINSMAGRYQPRQIFQDWIKMFALSMSNSFYFDNKLENEYLDIAKKYTNDQLNMFSEMSARLVMLFAEEISDYLGEIYMMLGASSVKTAQFFTPFHVSEIMAESTLTKWDRKKIILSEPTVGGGANILAIAKGLQKRKIDYQDMMIVTAQDLDYNCFYMAYVQFNLCGIPAKVIQGNTLAEEKNETLCTMMWYVKGCELCER